MAFSRPRFSLLASHSAFVASCLALIAVLARFRTFGDPMVEIDEQFYLLVGGRMLHGALPYVDIWDRKPIGLFALFAGFRALGGSGVLMSQIAALASVWGTAMLVRAIALRVASPLGAFAAGVLYITWLNIAGGQGTQTPVFYNLLMVAAVAILLRVQDRAVTHHGRIRRLGTSIMLLVGLALQIKYSVIFEGLFLGLALLWIAYRSGRPVSLLVLDAAIWCVAALAPTLLAALFYAAIGHFHEWLFANGRSILLRGQDPLPVRMHNLRHLIIILLPLLLPLLLRWSVRPRQSVQALLDLWAVVAILGVAVFGTWYIHYALPLLPPLALALAPIATRKAGQAALTVLIVGGTVWGQGLVWHHARAEGSSRVLRAATQALRGQPGCVFVYDGPVALYDAARSCLPTDHPFPGHLSQIIERGATGIDQVSEVQRILSTLPSRIVIRTPAATGEDPAIRRIIETTLHEHYQPIFRFVSSNHTTLIIYGRDGTVSPNPPTVIESRLGFFASNR